MGARASLRSGLSYSADATLEPPSRPLHPVPSQRLNLQTPPTCKFRGWLSNTWALEAHFPTPVAQQTEKKESSTPRAEKGENTRLFRACAGWRNSYAFLWSQTVLRPLYWGRSLTCHQRKNQSLRTACLGPAPEPGHCSCWLSAVLPSGFTGWCWPNSWAQEI